MCAASTQKDDKVINILEMTLIIFYLSEAAKLEFNIQMEPD